MGEIRDDTFYLVVTWWKSWVQIAEPGAGVLLLLLLEVKPAAPPPVRHSSVLALLTRWVS